MSMKVVGSGTPYMEWGLCVPRRRSGPRRRSRSQSRVSLELITMFSFYFILITPILTELRPFKCQGRWPSKPVTLTFDLRSQNLKIDFLGIISIFSYLRWNGSLFNISKFSKWPPFWGRDNFLTESCTKVENASIIAMSICDILSFWSTLWVKCWWRYSNFKLLPTLWPGDVINDVINTDLYKYNHNPMIPMYGKFNDDICIRFLVIMKDVLISFIKEYRAPTSRPPLSEVKL